MIFNTVILRGKIIAVNTIHTTLRVNLDLLEVQFSLLTETREFSETHPVLAYGLQAVQIIALTRDKLLPSDGMVEGQLHTHGEGSITVAKNINFFHSRREGILYRKAIQSIMDETMPSHLPGGLKLDA